MSDDLAIGPGSSFVLPPGMIMWASIYTTMFYVYGGMFAAMCETRYAPKYFG